MAIAGRLAVGPKPNNVVRSPAAVAPKSVAAGNTRKEEAPGLVHTATLIRGRVYVYKGVHFKKNIPVVVSKEVADYLKGEFHEVTDSDGEGIEKPYFDVEYDVAAPIEAVTERKIHRLPSKRPTVVRR